MASRHSDWSFWLGKIGGKSKSSLSFDVSFRITHLDHWSFSWSFLANKVSQIENRVFTICRFFWFISAFGKICFQHFQKLNLSDRPQADWAFGHENKTDFESWHSFCDLVQREWPISSEYHFAKIRLEFLNQIEQVHSPQNADKTTQVFEETVNEKRKFSKRVSPPNGNGPGVFKQGTSDISRTCSLVKTTRWSSQIDWFLVLFGCLIGKQSLVKPS